MSEEQNPGPPWTILKILRWTTGFFEERDIDSARLEAELLLAHTLEMPRIQLYAQFDRPLLPEELADFRALVKRRADREPTAYILGSREFWSLEFAVDKRVLIPRPDTESLVEAILARIDEDSTQRMVDIGTGSGAIALAIASERPELEIAATDISEDALEVARENAQSLGFIDRVSFFHGDLFDALPDEWLPLDIIVSNPPYVEEEQRSEIQEEVRDFEPSGALFAGPDGLDVIRRLIPASKEALKPGGRLLFEIGYRQGAAVTDLLEEQGFMEIEILTDYGDRDRVAAAQKPQ